MSRAKRVKTVAVPPEPPRDHRLEAIAEQAQRAGWKAEWQPEGGWLRVSTNGVAVDAFAGEPMNCYGQYYAWAGAKPSRTPLEALRAAYAALGVALDQAEDAFGGTS